MKNLLLTILFGFLLGWMLLIDSGAPGDYYTEA
jgi:hypothetical protein